MVREVAKLVEQKNSDSLNLAAFEKLFGCLPVKLLEMMTKPSTLGLPVGKHPPEVDGKEPELPPEWGLTS